MLDSVEKRKGRSSDGDLPGSELIEKGLADLEDGRESIESLLVSVGAPRLAGVGIIVPTPLSSPEHRLYELLASEEGDAAHSRYNALIRRLVSFERSAECAS
jgi:hypothetical protein